MDAHARLSVARNDARKPVELQRILAGLDRGSMTVGRFRQARSAPRAPATTSASTWRRSKRPPPRPAITHAATHARF